MYKATTISKVLVQNLRSSEVFILSCYIYSFPVTVTTMKANTDPMPYIGVPGTSFIITHLRPHYNIVIIFNTFLYVHFVDKKIVHR